MNYKESLIPSPSGSSRQAQRSWPPWKILVASALATVALWCTTSSRSESRAPVPPPTESGSGDWRWTDFAPSRSIEWHPCYNGELDCARLDLPMDWLEPSDDERVILALARLRAKDREDYRGPVIFNPGGPGGSGVWSLVDHGKYIQSIVGTNFDIVTFDPRGVGASVPRIECWETEQARSLWNLQAPGTIDSHPGVLSDVFARASAFSQTCERTLDKSGILRHSATASHAADLLQITKELGEEKIKFWGFSYGTILAGAFAAMYPERVDRIVSDGNVDYREWFLREHINFLQDTDKVMDAFYELCIEAGPVQCLMYDKNPVSIRRRIEAILEDLQKNPIVVAPSDEGPLLPQLITFSKIKAFISTSLYRPFHTFELLAKVLAVAEKRDGRALYEIFKPGDMLSLCAVETVPPTVPPDTLNEGTADVFSAVLCADTPQMNDTLDDFAEYAEAVQKMSYSAGAVNAVNRMGCVSRHIRPKWRVAGPFNANTSYPILFVNNIADNITPLISARNNSQSFPGSIVLIQNSYGHTSLSTPSTCTARAIRAYFQNGTLPQSDSVCEPDGRPFSLPAPRIVESQGDEITLAVQELSRKATFEFQARLHGLL